MKITRVDNETINCIVTEEDLSEQGIKLQDFFDRKQEAMDFIQNIMVRAAEEVDYHPNGVFMPMQISVLPDRTISITLSENSEDAFADLLRGLKIFTSQIKEIAERIHAKAEADKEEPESQSDGMFLSGSGQGIDSYVFEFSSMYDAISFCRQVPEGIDVRSRMYRSSRRSYLMVFERGEISDKVFASLFTRAYEFGRYVTTNPGMISSINENMEALISDDAIGTLRSL